MVRCSQGMQQSAMHSATIQRTTFFELGVYLMIYLADFKSFDLYIYDWFIFFYAGRFYLFQYKL